MNLHDGYEQPHDPPPCKNPPAKMQGFQTPQHTLPSDKAHTHTRLQAIGQLCLVLVLGTQASATPSRYRDMHPQLVDADIGLGLQVVHCGLTKILDVAEQIVDAIFEMITNPTHLLRNVFYGKDVLKLDSNASGCK